MLYSICSVVQDVDEENNNMAGSHMDCDQISQPSDLSLFYISLTQKCKLYEMFPTRHVM